MKKTREVIQKEALKVLKDNGYNGTICLSTGTGKSKVAIDAIKQGNFKNILITSPRTNLKENWKKELEKWGIIETAEKNVFFQEYLKETCGSFSPNWINITLENIQTCYKWGYEKLKEFDLIIADEIHTLVTEKYGSLIEKARNINIPVIGLTATPDNKKEEKELFYTSHIPIIYEYYDSAKDGLVNKRRYLVLEYELSDDFIITAGTKKKPFQVGEKTQYEYLTAQIRKGQQLMAGTGSEDWWNDAFNWFYKKQGNFEQKTAARIYLQAIKYRKEFLGNLTSSAEFSTKIKETILKIEGSKVLLFSENIKQAQKLSGYSIHSKQNVEENKKLLSDFDNSIIKELSSVRSLTLGLNIKGANYLIRESYNGSSVNSKQIDGRGDRLSVNDIATVIWIVPKGTQAETWFNKAMQNAGDIEIIYYNDINLLINSL